MDDRTARPLPPLRPERQFAPETMGKIGDVARPLTFIERLTNMTLVRRLVVLLVLAAAWEIYARILDNPLLFPSLTDTLAAFWDSAAHGVLIDRTLTSLRVLGMGYAIGLVAAGVFTTLAVSTRVGTDFLSTLTAMFNPLPAIALLPLALLWFGLGAFSIVFVIVHSVLWAVALNTHSGFLSVSPTLRMAGQNCGLTGLSYVMRLLVPAAFPSILTGLKIGWAFAWRTLIAAGTHANCRLRAEKPHVGCSSLRIELAQRSNVVQNPERTSERGNHQIIVMYREVADGNSGHIEP